MLNNKKITLEGVADALNTSKQNIYAKVRSVECKDLFEIICIIFENFEYFKSQIKFFKVKNQWNNF